MNPFPLQLPKLEEGTRGELLDAAFRAFYRNGFHGTGLSAILARTQATKGAVYYHFDDKLGLGYAVVDEVVRPWIFERWIDPLREASDPIAELVTRFEALAHLPLKRHRLGCPLNNLAQEMSAVDEGFRKRLNALYRAWRAEWTAILEDEQLGGRIDDTIDCAEVAAFTLSTLEGTMSMAKTDGDRNQIRQTLAALVRFLESLRT